MKNKALTYVLLLIVGFVWYKVFFRVKDNIFGEDVEIVAPNEPSADIKIAARDTVELNLNYRDPFYLKKAKPVSMNDPTPFRDPPSPVVRQRTSTPEFSWPKVEYYGLIRNRKSSKPLGLARVDGLIMNLREGDEIFNGIIAKDIESEFLTLQFKKLSKTVNRL